MPSVTRHYSTYIGVFKISMTLYHRLFKEMTMVVDKPEVAYPTSDAAWERFLQLFLTGYGLVFYAPVFEKFYYQSLLELYEDNVQYVELRGNLPPVSINSNIIYRWNNYLMPYKVK